MGIAYYYDKEFEQHQTPHRRCFYRGFPNIYSDCQGPIATREGGGFPVHFVIQKDSPIFLLFTLDNLLLSGKVHFLKRRYMHIQNIQLCLWNVSVFVTPSAVTQLNMYIMLPLQ